MNSTIQLLQAHRTYRHFDPDFTMPQNHVDAITASAKQAPSSMNGQHYSFVRITDKALREKIGALSTRNPQVVSAAEFWIVVADLHRMKLASEAYNGSFMAAGMEDSLLVATADAAFASQNALVAAESLGYGTCYIGGMRLIMAELISLLNLPKWTFPLFGLCMGKPAIEMQVKPRLDVATNVFENSYQTQRQEADLADYEKTMTAFAEARETLPWREKFSRYYSAPYGENTPRILREQGFLSHESQDK